MAGRKKRCVPISSENPPTGRRQVPVTNWSRRILFSLSISFTTCRKTSTSFFCDALKWCVCVCVCVCVCAYLPEPVNLFAVFGVMSINGVLLPICQIDLLHPTEHQLRRQKKRKDSYSSVLFICVKHQQAEGESAPDMPSQSRSHLAVGMYIYLGNLNILPSRRKNWNKTVSNVT